MMAGAATEVQAQVGRWIYGYNPRSLSPDGGSWQYINGRGQIIATNQLLPSPNTRWATPIMISSAQRSIRTVEAYGKTVFSARDARGNDVYFEQDPREVATAAAITRRSQVDSIRDVAEVGRYRVGTENRYRKKANRRDRDDGADWS
jgi:hypothetical protein